VGSVGCFAYMMTYEIWQSVRHARRLHVMKSLQRKGSVEDYDEPSHPNKVLSRKISFGAEAVIAAMAAPKREPRQRTILSLASGGSTNDSQGVSNPLAAAAGASKASGANWNVNPMKPSNGLKSTPRRNDRVLRMTKSELSLTNPSP
jgi:hypothetical protein